MRTMAPTGSKAWPLGTTTASLFVAYMLVLQSLAIGLAGAPSLLRGGAASGVCINASEAESQRGEPAGPGPSQGHVGDQCCVLHFAGAGLPPAAVFSDAPDRRFSALADWIGATTRLFSPWPTLPLGSRAPPSFLL
jgi:hypothetical protein